MFKSATFLAFIATSSLLILIGTQIGYSAPSISQQQSSCMRELDIANRSLAIWAERLESMINESKLPSNSRESIHRAANDVLDLIEDFGQQLDKRSPNELAKDLVSIRRQSNRLAIEVYLNTFDMRWVQTSMHLGTTVDRVQQACLTRNAIDLLTAPENPLEFLRNKL